MNWDKWLKARATEKVIGDDGTVYRYDPILGCRHPHVCCFPNGKEVAGWCKICRAAAVDAEQLLENQ